MDRDTSDDEVAFHLLPAKRTKHTEWGKCVLCQADSNETLSRATKTGILKFVEAAHQRQDDIYERLKPDINSLTDHSILWHKNCYATYTSPHNLKFATKVSPIPSPVQENTQVPARRRSARSQSSEMDWSMCMFCQKKTHKKVKKLSSVQTFSACKTIQDAAEEKGDIEMLTHIQGIDLIAVEAKYHEVCRAQYVAKRNVAYKTYKETDDEDLYSLAFNELVTEIEEGINHGQAYTMTFLLSRFKQHLADKGVEADNYRSEKLKSRLENHFEDLIVFHQQPGRSKPELVYSSVISLQDVINAASTLRQPHQSPQFVRDCKPEQTDSPVHILYHAAHILKQDVTNCEGLQINPLDTENLTLQKSKEIIPQSLYWFLRWIIERHDSDTEHYGDMSSSCTSEADERHIMMIGQDIIHCGSHGRKKMPKHVSLGMTVRHLTGSKQIITILNRMGHSVSYDDIEVVDTSLAEEVLAQSEKYGVVIPSNITPNGFVQIAADNNDINEETLDGKQTTHSTTMVVYQREQFGPKPQKNTNIKHATRKRALKVTDHLQHITECGAFGKRPAVRSFVDCIKKEWYACGESKKEAVTMDLAWAIVRMCPTKLFVLDIECQNAEAQTIPGWSAFNALICQSNPSRTQVGYCPMIAGSPTEFSTVYTVMEQAQKVTKSLGQKDCVITFDLAIYTKAKELQWRYPDEFSDVVIRLGGFHIALNYLAVIGKYFADSGLEDLLIESKTYGSSTASALLKGKSYNRGVRAHKLVMEALLRLQWQAFSHWIEDKGVNDSNSPLVKNLTSKIKQCRDSSAQDQMPDIFREFCCDLQTIQNLFTTFISEAANKSHLFAFWNLYIDMVQGLLQFIRAEREANWQLHLSATAELTPYFYCMDRTNYSRWLPIYLADMHLLQSAHPDVYEEFMKGNHPVSRSQQSFSQIWTDMALEQSVNLDSKTHGGIIGITKKPGTLERWFLTSHERATITTATKDMCGIQDSDHVGTHKESATPRLKRDETDVQQLLSVFKSELMTNPFAVPDDGAECLPLVNIATGVVFPKQMTQSFLNGKDAGREQMELFIDERLNTGKKNFWDTLPRLKLKTFASLSHSQAVKSKDDKLKALHGDRELFGRLIIAAKSRYVDLREVLTYELSTVPFAIAHSDGSLRKTVKSVLLAELEKEVTALPRLQFDEQSQLSAYVMDGMATIQMVKTGGAATFGELADKYWNIFLLPLNQQNCDRVDIVFDRYDQPQSIKTEERVRRGSSTSLEVKIAGPNTPIPRQWDKYMSNPVNKSNFSCIS